MKSAFEGLKATLSLGAIFLLSVCVGVAKASPTSPAEKHATPEYLLVYALDGKHFLFSGQTYDDTSIASAIKSADVARAVRVIVMRDAGQGLTIGELLAVIPALDNGKSCMFFQDANSMKSVSINGKDGKPVEQSFCPKLKDVSASVGPYAAPP